MALPSKSKKAVQRTWRPDFRDVTSLPDTKVIRTGFLLNFIAIFLAALSVTLYGMREYSLQGLIRSVRALEAEVNESTARNRSILDSNKQFLQGAEVAAEVIAFDSQPVSYPKLIAELAEMVKDGILLTSMEFGNPAEAAGKAGIPPFVIQLKGNITEAASATPSQILSGFQKGIRELPSLAGKDVEIETANFSRNNTTGRFDFSLLVKVPVDKPVSL